MVCYGETIEQMLQSDVLSNNQELIRRDHSILSLIDTGNNYRGSETILVDAISEQKNEKQEV